MKKYGVTHKGTGAEVSRFDDLRTANEVAKSLGDHFTTITWVGFGGLPAAACVMRDDGQLETICLYQAEAERVAAVKNEMRQEGHSYHVQMVMLNTAYPHAHGEYSA
ncbi:hypothetical protein Pan1_86 [Pseudanabaena phage Pan1]|nr:hypothetical protein Pan1_86 [Pseudanabaena phage Pan1]